MLSSEINLLNIHFMDENRHDMIISRIVADEIVPRGMLPEDQAATSLGCFVLTYLSPVELQAAHVYQLYPDNPAQTLTNSLQEVS